MDEFFDGLWEALTDLFGSVGIWFVSLGLLLLVIAGEVAVHHYTGHFWPAP